MSRCTTFFHQIDAPMRIPGIHWQAAMYLDDGSELPFPVAMAWLSDYRSAAFEEVRYVLLDFILVPDKHRRQGYASQLIKACRGKWPQLKLTDAISKEGEGLLASLRGCEMRTCSWPGCDKTVPDYMWGCKPHLSKLPPSIRLAIWAAYETGQEDDLGAISDEYRQAFKAALDWIKTSGAK